MTDFLGKAACWLGRCLVKPDDAQTDGLWWGFCRRCGARHVMGWNGKWRLM